MQEDLLRELGYANLDTRLKRISDKMIHSLRAMYKKLDLDVEPSWYLVLFILNKEPNSSVMDIANQLQFRHQSIIVMTQKMIANGYLAKAKDPMDNRRTIFSLTEKAKKRLPLFREIWESGKKVTYELLNKDIAIMKYLEIVETNLEENSFGDRIIEKLK